MSIVACIRASVLLPLPSSSSSFVWNFIDTVHCNLLRSWWFHFLSPVFFLLCFSSKKTKRMNEWKKEAKKKKEWKKERNLIKSGIVIFSRSFSTVSVWITDLPILFFLVRCVWCCFCNRSIIHLTAINILTRCMYGIDCRSLINQFGFVLNGMENVQDKIHKEQVKKKETTTALNAFIELIHFDRKWLFHIASNGWCILFQPYWISSF